MRKTGPDEAGTGGGWRTKDFFLKKKHHAHHIGRLAQPLGRHVRVFGNASSCMRKGEGGRVLSVKRGGARDFSAIVSSCMRVRHTLAQFHVPNRKHPVLVSPSLSAERQRYLDVITREFDVVTRHTCTGQPQVANPRAPVELMSIGTHQEGEAVAT